MWADRIHIIKQNFKDKGFSVAERKEVGGVGERSTGSFIAWDAVG